MTMPHLITRPGEVLTWSVPLEDRPTGSAIRHERAAGGWIHLEVRLEREESNQWKEVTDEGRRRVGYFALIPW